MDKETREVRSITDAPQRHSEEQHRRMLRYGLAMGLRMVCFVLAGITALVWETWWSLLFVAAAVVLPYVAVVDANAGGDRYLRGNEADSPERLLSVGPEEPQSAPRPQWWEEQDAESTEDPPAEHDVIPGEVIRDNDP